MKHLLHKLYEPTIGAITAIWAFDRWDELLFSVIVAFVGGIAAYLGKQLSIYIIQKLAKVRKRDETN